MRNRVATRKQRCEAIKDALEFMATVGSTVANGSSPQELYEPIYELARDAEKAFNEAKQELDKFCPP
jgi:hypothetical protein